MARIVDLTLALRPGMRGVEFAPKHDLARDGWNSSMLHLYSHAGTHVDAQFHFGAGSETVDQIAASRCVGPAWVVRLDGVRPKQLIQIADLGSIAERFAPGESLLLATGWSRHAEDRSLYRDQLPRVSEELACWCVERQVKILGIEPPSVADVHNRDEVASVHRILLSGDVLIVEGLANLESLRDERVLLAVFPLKLEGIDGSPARAVAIEGVPLEPFRECGP